MHACWFYVVIAVGWCIAAYPQRRLVTSFEFLTDGLMPDGFAGIAQDTLGRMWIDAFASEAALPPVRAVEAYLRRSRSGAIVEIAAGSGVASALWAERLPSRPTVLLTDLQPNPEAWEALSRAASAKGRRLSYVNRSVSAFDVEASLEPRDADALRTVHFALHHFPPDSVRRIFESVVNSSAALLIGDLAPTGGGVLWNGVLGWKHALSAGRAEAWVALRALPWWGPLLLPALPLMGWWDATTSVLRAYSVAELTHILASVPGGERYRVAAFDSESYGVWILGRSEGHRLLRTVRAGLTKALGLDHTVCQWVMITPPLRK